MTLKVTEFDTSEALIQAACELLGEHICSEEDDPRAIILPGGTTPIPVYEKVSRSGWQAGSDLHIIYSDERVVPVDSPANNYSQTKDMIQALGIPDEQVIRVETEYPLAESAKRYDSALAAFLGMGGRIPLGLLGLGSDGHTASLFSEEDIERGRNRLIVAVPKKDGPDRVSVTPLLLRRCERLVFIVFGADKRSVCDALIEHPETIPAGMATHDVENLELWMACS